MELSSHLEAARQAAKDKAKQRKATQIFQFSWRSTGSEFVTGWAAVCSFLQCKESTLAVRLSASGNAYTLTRNNPAHGEPDILTISRVSPPKAEPAKRGRKPRQFDMDRLGTEFAPPARPMPKQTNRRTGEK